MQRVYKLGSETELHHPKQTYPTTSVLPSNSLHSPSMKNLETVPTKELIKIISQLTTIIDINIRMLAEGLDDVRRELKISDPVKHDYGSYFSIDTILDDIKPPPDQV
jgi:hypothetical protein